MATRGPARASRLSLACLFLALAAARAPSPVSAGRLIRRDADEERLIGWLGEVPRERARSADADGSVPLGSNPTPTATPARAAYDDRNRYLNVSGIGVGDPNVVKLSDAPRAFLHRGFLTPEECEHIIRVGEPHLHRSSVVAGQDDATGEDKGAIDDIRTSYGMFLPKAYDDITSSVERRVEAFSRIPYENQEQLQLLRYVDGQQYKDHMDGLVSPNGGRRIATVLMFLHEPDLGGETSFPGARPTVETKARLRELHGDGKLSDCAWREGRGMAVKPRRGDAVLFFSFDEAGRTDHASMHASCPTLGGTKWTATKWIHESTFETGTWTPPECEDKERRCGEWAAAGECAKNPGFMLGTEVAGSCLRSCCAGAVDMPEKMTAWQVEFCASCEGTPWVGEFRRMRGARLGTTKDADVGSGAAEGEDGLR